MSAPSCRWALLLGVLGASAAAQAESVWLEVAPLEGGKPVVQKSLTLTSDGLPEDLTFSYAGKRYAARVEAHPSQDPDVSAVVWTVSLYEDSIADNTLLGQVKTAAPTGSQCGTAREPGTLKGLKVALGVSKEKGKAARRACDPAKPAPEP